MYIKYNFEQMDEDEKKFFIEMLSYVSGDIEEIKREDQYILIKCEDQKEDNVRVAIEKLCDMIQGDALKSKKVLVKTIKDFTNNKMENEKNIFQDLIETEMITKMADGAYAYSGLFLDVFNYFDRKIDEFAKETFPEYKKYVFPVLYPIKDYKAGGYFEAFPHHIMFQGLLKNEIDVIDRFTKQGISNDMLSSSIAVPKNVLRHAACVPVYPILSNKVVNTKDPKVFVISGKCFRNEEKNVEEISRLNEFYMKEYVFVGTKEQCENGIEKSKKLWNEWIERFGLNGKIETATDSFFASNYKKLKLFQALGNSKQEYKLRLPGEDRFCSCGSANYHRTHFSKPYNIKNEEGSFCYTACFAFGIDRLTYTFLSQKGLDVEKWDDDIREEIEKIR